MSTGVIESRERLRNELRRVRTFEEEKRQSVRFLTKELTEAERADDTALTAYIRQQNKPTLAAHEEANGRRKRLAEELTKAQAHTEAAAVARRAVQDELTLLYAEEFPIFAEEAEKITEEAHAKLLALAEPYMAAMKAWQLAVTMWGPLAPAIRDRLIDHENATGLFPDPSYRNDASRVAVFPLPNPAQVFGAVQEGTLTARPRALEPDAIEDEVIEESIAGTG